MASCSNHSLNDGNITAMDDSSKRRSSRSIKRRKFDDELVESSLGVAFGSPMPKAQRSRTQSLNLTTSATELDNVMSPVNSIPEIGLPVNSVPSISSAPPRKVPSSRMSLHASTLNSYATVASTSSVSSSSYRNRSRKQKHLNKDLGRWKPTDDLMLIQSVLQTNNLQMVHRGVKFSCRFTHKEIAQRWYALLYDPTISRLAVSAMKNLHPETIANIESKALFSIAEEELLASVQSNSQPTIETFQELLAQNPNIFHRRRTAKILMCHWQLMKRYSLLSDQCSALENPIPLPLMSAIEDRNIHILNNEQEVTTLSTSEHIPTFAECEELLNDQHLLSEMPDPVLERHLTLTNKKVKKEMKVLEDELPRAQVLVFPMTGINPVEFEPQTLAVLRGRLVRYLMRSKEITIGRSSKYQQVDVDLKLEGPAWKISRRQATIRLRNTGDFLIVCEGKKCLYVDGKPLTAGSRCRLNHNSVLEIAGLRFLFLINHQLINTIKQDSIQLNQSQLQVQTLNQTPQKQANQNKSQKSATKAEKAEKNAQLNEQKQQQQKIIEEQQKKKLEEHHKRLIEEERQKLLQQEHDELEQQLKLLEAEEEEHNQRQQQF
ncbi:microspherule protein 1 [Daktulosphaira vitifoliae]|uniref:microspherule protein 1 n=1 Tax=Daktulosphaira vitifoliae TaxID=58002 RepID=UPI0021AAF1C7|nr:microspherule protein 1 [Daktulosphaira vitifoliae]